MPQIGGHNGHEAAAVLGGEDHAAQHCVGAAGLHVDLGARRTFHHFAGGGLGQLVAGLFSGIQSEHPHWRILPGVRCSPHPASTSAVKAHTAPPAINFMLNATEGSFPFASRAPVRGVRQFSAQRRESLVFYRIVIPAVRMAMNSSLICRRGCAQRCDGWRRAKALCEAGKSWLSPTRTARPVGPATCANATARLRLGFHRTVSLFLP